MAGIYGDLLMFFPELFDQVSYFTAEPRVSSGYEKTAEGITDAIIMTEKTLTTKLGKYPKTDSNDILTYSDKEYCFAPEGTELKVGYFIIHPRENTLYAVTNKSDWEKEGGFIRFDIELVQGATGEEPPVLPKGGKF